MPVPTPDQLIQELNQLEGTSDVDYAAYVLRMDFETNDDATNEFSGRFLKGILNPQGIRIRNGVTRTVRRILQDIVVSLNPEELDDVRRSFAGLGEILGTQRIEKLREDAAGNVRIGHGFGTCIDIPAPYLMNEAGEASLDAALALAYEDISVFTLGRSSIIPTLKNSTLNTGEVYDRLKEESDGFVVYFEFLDKPRGALATHIAAMRNLPQWLAKPEAQLRKATMVQQYMLLAEHPKPWYNDLTTLGQIQNVVATPLGPRQGASGNIDRPFTSTDPRKGFMATLPRGFTIALSMEGMRWGACELGHESGDLMHFQLESGNPFLAKVRTAYANAKTRL